MFKQEKLIKMLREELKQGEKIAFDRKNNILPDLALRKTTITSEWWIQECHVCHDTFRENDHVRICPQCKQVYHDDVAFNLRCWGKNFTKNKTCCNCNYHWDGSFPTEKILQAATTSIPLMEEQFFTGLVDTWKIFGDAKILIVKPDSHIIGHQCLMCQYKIRAGDRVVKCPCSAQCEVYLHNDVLRKWTCWNEWNGEQGKNYCPQSGKLYRQKVSFNKIDNLNSIQVSPHATTPTRTI